MPATVELTNESKIMPTKTKTQANEQLDTQVKRLTRNRATKTKRYANTYLTYYQDGAGNFTKRNSAGKEYNSICNLQRPLTKIKWILYWNNGELTFYINECQGRKYWAKIDKNAHDMHR